MQHPHTFSEWQCAVASVGVAVAVAPSQHNSTAGGGGHCLLVLLALVHVGACFVLLTTT
jgi:hypothetical protein